MTDRIREPAPRPCQSCPYRQDIPSGVWAPEEYNKLAAYDQPTPYQPPAVFLCHQHNGRACSGWAGCHDGNDLLALRFATMLGTITTETATAITDYQSPVPLWETGTAAAAHGLADISQPGTEAVTLINKINRKGGTR